MHGAARGHESLRLHPEGWAERQGLSACLHARLDVARGAGSQTVDNTRRRGFARRRVQPQRRISRAMSGHACIRSPLAGAWRCALPPPGRACAGLGAPHAARARLQSSPRRSFRRLWALTADAAPDFAFARFGAEWERSITPPLSAHIIYRWVCWSIVICNRCVLH
jgi:hypothetical protein